MSKDELIALARKLYGEGMSYGKIADKFNADGVPTASGKGSWERKMIQRLVSADTLKKAEVKVGLKSERESQLESEVESLKAEIVGLRDTFRKEFDRINFEHLDRGSRLVSELQEIRNQFELLESENAGLRSDRDEALKELNRVKQDNEELARKESFLRERLADSVGHVNGNLKVIADLNAENDRLKESNELLQKRYDGIVNEAGSSLSKLTAANDQLRTQLDCFKAESERLTRQLTESESKYKALYESEITRLGSELAIANQRLQELQDKQLFIKPESESGVPKNFNGWTVGKRSDGRGYNIYRKIAGKLHGLYIGKEWNADDARNKIAAFESKQKQQSDLFPVSECKSCQHQPEFESRLRQVCPETIRTYRLDTVAGNFPDCNFGSEMIALAEQKRIELLAGDASQCDVSKLVQYRGRMYVNFEWR